MPTTAKRRRSRAKVPAHRAHRRSLRGPSKPKYRGLCSTCVNAAGCTFPRVPGRAVFHCEEFDDGRFRLQATAAPAAEAGSQPPAARKKSASKLMGLCSICENRSTCAFPKHEGGVWHCEEYV